MSSTLFKAGGALVTKDLYINRHSDYEALHHLRAMDYVMFIEPHQQGKTSLINHLSYHPTLGNVAFIYLDVSTLDRSTEAAWYQTLYQRIMHQWNRFAPLSYQGASVPQNSSSWYEFLWEISKSAASVNRYLIIALDEIGAFSFPGATEFFSVLRGVFNSRQVEPAFNQMTFILAGAFEPRELINDDRISPFNIAHRVRLLDFTKDQVNALIGAGSWSREQSAVLAERVYYWTDGQPYLSQLLCSYLGPNATRAHVDAQVERLFYMEQNHIPVLLNRLRQEDKLLDYVKRILAGEYIKFIPSVDSRQIKLELLGVVKADKDGYCVIRNRIYEQALT